MELDIIKDLESKDILEEKIKREFNKVITENLFYIEIEYLKNNSNEVLFKEEWNFNPQKTSSEFYGSKYFSPIILLVNNIPTLFDFNISMYKKIKIPTIDAITTIADMIKI